MPLAMVVVTLIVISLTASIYSLQQSAYAVALMDGSVRKVAAPVATSGNNIYVAWPNDDMGHWGVFFAKSTDGGKTLSKTMMLSAPNNGRVVDLNVDIAASGSNVLVTWWTNKTGVFMPVFKASNDNGDTFGKTIMLNSTEASP
jgi:hypothetical protein